MGYRPDPELNSQLAVTRMQDSHVHGSRYPKRVEVGNERLARSQDAGFVSRLASLVGLAVASRLALSAGLA